MNRFALASRRHLFAAGLVVIIEILYYRQYAHLAAEFHFWLHGLFGAALGLAAATVWTLLTNKVPKMSGWEAGLLGHLYSTIPDVLFVGFGILHMYWMDIFALHISIHFIPAPILTMLGIFILSLLAYGFARDGGRRLASALLMVAAIVLAIALWQRQPIPAHVRQLQNHNHNYAWLCPMWDIVKT